MSALTNSTIRPWMIPVNAVASSGGNTSGSRLRTETWRITSPQPDSARHAAITAIEARYAEIVRTGHGHIFFLAGAEGCGRSATLRTLTERFGDDIDIHGPAEPAARGGVFSFTYRDIHPHDLTQVFDQHGVCVRAGHHCAKPLMRELGVAATARESAGTLVVTLQRLADFPERAALREQAALIRAHREERQCETH